MTPEQTEQVRKFLLLALDNPKIKVYHLRKFCKAQNIKVK